ncbi:MAG TPA: hypothetical protein VHT97_13550 [Acidimicrobiales bacterium]|nr:hypothetical protein [Acidimicrobiales bacterium]
MRRKSRWYDAVPDATAVIDCEGEPHRVTWRRGKVVLEAHDLTSERTMLAFGGDLCPCMRVLEMWVEQFRMPPDLFTQMPTWLGENAFLVPTELAEQRRLAMVVSWDRLWRFESWLPNRQARLLDEAIKVQALPHLRAHLNAWKARTGARVISGCQVGLARGPETAVVEGTTDRVAMRATARLHPRWLVDVQPRAVAVVEDAFVVELTEATSVDDLLVSAVRWEPNGPGTWATVAAPARIRREPATGGDWHLTWEER